MSGGIVETLIATSLLMALVLLVRGAVARAFGARAALALWLAPLARLVLPPVPVEAGMPQMLVETGAATAVALQPAAAAWPLSSIFLTAWLTGAALFLAWHLLRYHRFLATALESARPMAVPEIGDAAVLESAAVTGPAATGLIVRRIFVPAGFADRFSLEERELALMHEALHHRRGDLWASGVALLVLALHWFNPLAHAAHRAFRRDLEAACDATLLARRGASARQAYARTILRCVAQPMPHPSCALTHLDELKGRLEMLKLDHGALRRSAGLALAAAFLGGGMLIAQPATAQEQEVEQKVEKIVIHKSRDGKVVTGDMPEHLREKFANCQGEAFEAQSALPADGTQRVAKILLCGKPGATKAEVAAMLEKALGRLEGSDRMPAENKAEIVERLKARIAELRAGN